MKIKQIHIYGYGKFIDYHINDISNMQVFFGKNEAGKTTIMSFIHSILFGFPTRLQTAFTYEPKKHSAYGGKLVLETGYGEVIVERIKGKATGDVTVQLKDGTIENETFLHKLLNGMDKRMYQSIFSFNLDGIREIHRLTDEELSKYLIAAGSVGSDILLQADKKFQKELDLLFKPTGRKPELNVLLKSLREQDQQLKIAKKENASYIEVCQKIETLQDALDTYNNDITAEKSRLEKIDQLIKHWPLIQELDQIKGRLKEIGSIQFPIDGLARFEKLEQQLIYSSGKLKSVQEKMDEIKLQIEESSPNLPVDRSKIEILANEYPKYVQVTKEISNLKRLIETDHEQAILLMNEAGVQRNQVNRLNLGMDMKGRIRETVQQYVKLETKNDDLQEELHKEKELLAQLEHQCTVIEDQLVDENTFRNWQTEMKSRPSVESLHAEKTLLENEIKELEESRDSKERQRKQKRKQQSIFSGIFILASSLLFVWSMLSKEWTFAFFTLAIIVYIAISSSLRKGSEDQGTVDFVLKSKVERLKKIKTLLETQKQSEQYEQQIALREDWKRMFANLETQKQRVEEVKVEYERNLHRMREVKDVLDDIKGKLGLNKQFSSKRLEDAFDLLKRRQQLVKQIQGNEEHLERLKGEQQQWEARVFRLAKMLHIRSADVEEIVFEMKKRLKHEEEKEYRNKEANKKWKELHDEEILVTHEINELKTAMEHLQKLANAANQEDFRERAKLFDEKNRLIEKKSLFINQLGAQIKEAASYGSLTELEAEREQLREVIQSLEQDIDTHRNQLASLHHERNLLEEGGTYTQKLHNFYHLKSKFNNKAKQWAAIALAKTLLSDTLDLYKQDRFPQAINKAQKYFNFLTDGEYTHVHIKDDGYLLVEHKNKTLFHTNELSRGTSEQLYTAIRFGLVHVLRKDYPVPIIIDDGFVNFDSDRTNNVLKLIQQLSEDTQVLFFTCHPHLLSHFQENDVIELGKRKNPVSLR